jgi:hypothetical protein
MNQSTNKLINKLWCENKQTNKQNKLSLPLEARKEYFKFVESYMLIARDWVIIEISSKYTLMRFICKAAEMFRLKETNLT